MFGASPLGLDNFMGLPVSALSDLELIHYATIDDDAKGELARRLATSTGLELCDHVIDLEAQVLEFQRQEDAACCSCSMYEASAETLQDCINRVRKLIKDHKEMDHAKLSEAVDAALKEMDDFH
jgi:hypothetical protein